MACHLYIYVHSTYTFIHVYTHEQGTVIVLLQLVFSLMDMQFRISFYFLEIATVCSGHIGSMSAGAKFKLRFSHTVTVKNC